MANLIFHFYITFVIFSSVVLKLMFLINNVVSISGSSISSSGSILVGFELFSTEEKILIIKYSPIK